jgi:hypothetical protein
VADSYDQLRARLVDVAEPPVPNRSSPLTEMTEGEARKHTLMTLGFALLFGVPSAALFYYGHWIWGAIVGLVAILMLVAAFSKKSRVARCPYCASQMIVDGEESADPRQCEKCCEYSVLKAGALVPLDPTTISPTPTFEAPLFKDALWPNGCVACGAPPTRLDDATGRTINAAHLVVARVSVSSGRAQGIPYCESHRDSVTVKVGQDRKVRLLWCSLPMMRRYLRANSQRGTEGRVRV